MSTRKYINMTATATTTRITQIRNAKVDYRELHRCVRDFLYNRLVHTETERTPIGAPTASTLSLTIDKDEERDAMEWRRTTVAAVMFGNTPKDGIIVLLEFGANAYCKGSFIRIAVEASGPDQYPFRDHAFSPYYITVDHDEFGQHNVMFDELFATFSAND